MTFIQCHAPTNIAAGEEKQKFFEELRGILFQIHKGDIIFSMGNFISKVSNNNINLEHVMGKHGVGTMNENGEVLTNF